MVFFPRRRLELKKSGWTWQEKFTSPPLKFQAFFFQPLKKFLLQHVCTWSRCYELRISRRKHNFPLQHEQCYEVTDKKFHQTNLFFSSRWKHFLEPLKNSWKSKISKKPIVEQISKEKVSFSTNMHTSKESYCFKEKCQFHKNCHCFVFGRFEFQAPWLVIDQ